MQKTLNFCSIITGLTLLIAGCGQKIPNTDEAIEKGILLLGNSSEPKTLDPQLATGVTENKIIMALMEGLIAYHPTDDNIPAPGVAESWHSNDEASVWTFNIREDALWSNGDPVIASDFVYAYRRMLDPLFTGEYAQMLYILKGAQAYKEGGITDFTKVGVKAMDDKTLQLELIGSIPYLPNMLKHYAWFPVHQDTIEVHGGMVDRSATWTLPENFVGNGAFRLSEWLPNQYLSVIKSDTYWDREAVELNKIIFFPISDVNTEKRMFDSGMLHKTSTVPSNEIPRLKAERPDEIHLDNYLGTYFYQFNVTREPLDDPMVRKALAHAIDRETLVEKVTLGDQSPATAFVPPGFEGYSTPNALGFHPEKAKEYLADAGYPEGKGFPDLYLLFNTSENHRKIAEAIVAMWNDVLGINIQLENKEWKVYLDAQSHLDYDISRSGWIGDYMDPITFLDLFTSGNGNNDTGWGSADYDQFIRIAFESKSYKEHLKALQEAEKILMEELPVLPIYWYTRIYLLDERVKGHSPKLLDNHPYKYIHF